MFENVRLAVGTILENLRRPSKTSSLVCCMFMGACRYETSSPGSLAFQYGGGKREDPGTQRTKTIADWAFIRALSLVYSFQNKDGDPLRASRRLISAFFSVWDLQGGQNSGLIVWKTVTVPLEGKDSKIVGRFNSCFHRCSAGVLRYTRSSFGQTSYFIHLQMRIISYEISGMIIAGIYYKA